MIWEIDFKGMSNYWGLFYALSLGNCLCCIYTFCVVISLEFFWEGCCIQSDWIQIILNRSIWPIDGTLTGTTTPSQSGTRNNGNERVLHIALISRTGVLVSYPGHPNFHKDKFKMWKIKLGIVSLMNFFVDPFCFCLRFMLSNACKIHFVTYLSFVPVTV